MPESRKKALVTGGAGFIGSALVRHLVRDIGWHVLNVDKLTYAANLASLSSVEKNEGYSFLHADICDRRAIDTALSDFKPELVIHLAAESHVDRSVDSPAEFVETNVVGTYVLLEAALSYWRALPEAERREFRFHHISTDEVFGSLGETGLFSETTQYKPNSPYAASKASSDHFVRAWHHSFGLPVVMTNCSNNYGPFQFPEKLIPLMILNALEGRPLPVYGDGRNVRDWLFVEDHVSALVTVALKGRIGETYAVGGNNEMQNIDVVTQICDLVDELAPALDIGPRRGLITFVMDRPGHDRRYAIDASKIAAELDWTPSLSFDEGLRRTVEWYLANESWWGPLRRQYDRQRLGLARETAASAGSGL